MPEKRSLPLNNPNPPKSNINNTGNKRILTRDRVIIDGRERKESPRGRGGRARPVEALIKCLQCGRVQKIVFEYGKPPGYHKCIWCNQVQPADGYKLTAYGLGLPQPLAPHEVQTRQIERDMNYQK